MPGQPPAGSARGPVPWWRWPSTLERALDLAASVIAEMSDRPEIEAYLGELIRNASDGPRGKGSRFIPLTPLCSLRLEREATVAERRH
jgi:hypothetical protein